PSPSPCPPPWATRRRTCSGRSRPPATSSTARCATPRAAGGTPDGPPGADSGVDLGLAGASERSDAPATPRSTGKGASGPGAPAEPPGRPAHAPGQRLHVPRPGVLPVDPATDPAPQGKAAQLLRRSAGPPPRGTAHGGSPHRAPPRPPGAGLGPGRSADLLDADRVARGVAEGAVADAVGLLRRLLDDLGAGGLHLLE